MKSREESIIRLNDIIHSKKNKLTKKDREYLIVLREEIRNAKSKKGLAAVLRKLLKFVGFDLDLFNDE